MPAHGVPYTSIGKIGENPQPDRVLAAVQPLLEAFAAGKIDRIYLASNTFVNTVSQVPTILQLAPVEPIETEVYKRPQTDLPWDYIYEPEASQLLDELMQRYVESVVYAAVLENHACEQAAKMVAMKNATENAGELMDGLQLAYNNARQAAITAELAGHHRRCRGRLGRGERINHEHRTFTPNFTPDRRAA